jgi:hypothetical protein
MKFNSYLFSQSHQLKLLPGAMKQWSGTSWILITQMFKNQGNKTRFLMRIKVDQKSAAKAEEEILAKERVAAAKSAEQS